MSPTSPPPLNPLHLPFYCSRSASLTQIFQAPARDLHALTVDRPSSLVIAAGVRTAPLSSSYGWSCLFHVKIISPFVSSNGGIQRNPQGCLTLHASTLAVSMAPCSKRRPEVHALLLQIQSMIHAPFAPDTVRALFAADPGMHPLKITNFLPPSNR